MTKYTVFLLCFLNCSQATVGDAATYYVRTDGNDVCTGLVNAAGSSGSCAWKTIQYASNTMAAGDTVLVQAGSYSETARSSRSGMSESNRIIFRAVGTVNSRQFLINHSYITVDGFNLSGSIPSYEAYVSIGPNGHHATVSNNIIDATGYPDRHGIRQTDKSVTYSKITGNNIGNVHGVASMDMGGTDHWIERNAIHDWYDDAFRTEGCIRCTLKNNLMYNGYEEGRHTDCYQTFGDNGHPSYDVVFDGNICRDAQAQAFMLTKDSPDIRGYTFRNNIWANINLQGQTSMPGMTFYNNTFYNVGAGNGGVALRGDTVSTGMIMRNNIFVDCGDRSSTGAYSTTATDLDADYSYVALGSNGNWGPVRNPPSETHLVNGVKGNIPFTNYATENFTLRSASRAVNAGISIGSFSHDLLGNNRPQGAAWDIGAYKYEVGGPNARIPSAPTITRVNP